CLNLLLGLWVLVSPWVLGFQGTAAAIVHIVVGILVAALAAEQADSSAPEGGPIQQVGVAKVGRGPAHHPHPQDSCEYAPRMEAGKPEGRRRPRVSQRRRQGRVTNRGLIPTMIAAGITKPVLDDKGDQAVDEHGKPRVTAKYTGMHALRHFFASWLINRPADGGLGLPPKSVQERMGHSSI